MKQPSISGSVEMWKSGNGYLILNMKQLSISGSVEMWKSGLGLGLGFSGPDNARGQISVHIFAPNGGYCLFVSI